MEEDEKKSEEESEKKSDDDEGWMVLKNELKEEDPKVKEGVKKLENLGYENEGGALAKLVIAQSGDVDKVVAILKAREEKKD